MIGIVVGIDVAQLDSSEDNEEGNGMICVCKCLIVNKFASSTSAKKLSLGIAFGFLALLMDVCWGGCQPGWNSTQSALRVPPHNKVHLTRYAVSIFS